MENKMEDYYKVMQYLREMFVDRQYPYEFEDEELLGSDSSISLVDSEYGDFEKSLQLESIKSGDVLRMTLPKPRDFTDCTSFEVSFYCSEEFDPQNLVVGFSNKKKGYINQVELDSGNIVEAETYLNKGGHYLIKYNLKDTNTKMAKKDRRLSHTESISLIFGQEVSELILYDAVLRTANNHITLEDLDETILMGTYYIQNQLLLEDAEDIPLPLQHLNYKSAGAYTWLIWWENESKVQDDGTKEGRNYATRLFDQIDLFLDKWLEAHPTGNTDPNLKLLGFTTYQDFPIKRRIHEIGNNQIYVYDPEDLRNYNTMRLVISNRLDLLGAKGG